jgi:glycosyltransferase involved in cell wall biosynthesis
MTRPRILFTCGNEAAYVRNLLVRRALHQQFEVVEVTDDRPGSLLVRNLRLLPRLLRALRTPHDLVFAGFYGYLLTLFLKRVTGRPILLDAFVSNWDTLCFDRQSFQPYSMLGRLAFRLDRSACLAAGHCVLDTATHRRYFVDTFGLPDSHVSTYYVGYDEELFYPRPAGLSPARLVVFYYGSYLPLHGVEHIVRAAKLLESEPDIEFQLIGDGIMYPPARQLAQELHLQRLTFHPPAPYAALPAAIAEASICLGGPFGCNDKARRVIASKTFQFLAMGKATIVGDSPANREVFTHGEDVMMCRMADAKALASAILCLCRDSSLRTGIAQRGQQHCQDAFGMHKQSLALRQIIERLL